MAMIPDAGYVAASRQEFDIADVNQDHQLDNQELKAQYGERGDEVLEAADANHDGVVSKDEMVQWKLTDLLTRRLNKELPELHMKFASAFDAMLPIPRPLPDEYRYITEVTMLKEAKMVAPYHETGEVPLFESRIIGSLACMAAGH